MTDPFGHEVRAPLDPVEAVHRLAEMGAYGVNFHDDDLVPPGAEPVERERIVKRFRAALDETGMKVPMATTNLFSRPVFKEGAFTANDPAMVGLNPEFAHETMSGLNFTHGVAQVLWHGKLFHIDLNGQRVGKFDQDFRFGSEGVRDAFYLVRLLEDSGWDGMRHFDAHPYRTEDEAGVWDFARGCMRSYLIFKDKAERMRDDAEIQEALRGALAGRLAEPTGPLDTVHSAELDERALATQGYGHELLDQLVTELLLGVR